MGDHAVSELLGKHDEAIRNLVDWQREQNGVLRRLEEKVDAVNENVNRRFEKIYVALIGLLGGITGTLLLQLVNLSLRK